MGVITLLWMVVTLAFVVGRIHEHRRRLELTRESEDTIDDEAVGRLGRALGDALGLQEIARSHREKQVALRGTIGARTCELRIDPRGYAARLELRGRLPEGVHVQRVQRETGDERTHRCELGQVRGEVPEGLMPLLIAGCDARVSTLSLVGGQLRVSNAAPLHGREGFAGRPEQIVALLAHALALAERLEHEFR